MRSPRCLRRLLTAAVLLSIALPSYGREPREGKEFQIEEYRVYEAALAALDPAADASLRVAIYHRTLNGACGKDAGNPVLVKACTFLWIKPDTPADVEQMLRKRMRKFSKSAWKDFLAKNKSSVALHEPIKTPWKHQLFGGDIREVDFGESSAAVQKAEVAAEGGEPHAQSSPREGHFAERAVYLSRVGLDSKRTHAILYVLVFSYDGGVAVSGDYLHLRAKPRHKGKFRDGEKRQWYLAGRVHYFSGVKDSFASLASPSAGAAPQGALLAQFTERN
jgi:hypothetical protein